MLRETLIGKEIDFRRELKMEDGNKGINTGSKKKKHFKQKKSKPIVVFGYCYQSGHVEGNC